jgi:ubiquinone/menaquinone biosynthesis C-methylase UbiE
MYQSFKPSFDKIAEDYDRLWSSTAIGMSQRNAVWRAVDPLFQQGNRILDVGCGTGIDALHFQSRGVQVYGIDSSPKMIEVAKRRGVDAQVWPIESLNSLQLGFDGAISNFGALNCVEGLDLAARALARLIRKGGHLALCFLGRICAWEIGYYLLHGNLKKAFRRLSGHSRSELAGNVFYFSNNFIISTFDPYFRLKRYLGIGLCVPASYAAVSQHLVANLTAIDERLAHRRVLRSLSDHTLYILERL